MISGGAFPIFFRRCPSYFSMGGEKSDEQMLAALQRPIEPNRQLIAQSGRPRWPDHFEYHFHGQESNHSNLIAILGGLREGTTELMCHPGYAEGLQDAYRAPREIELCLLTDPAIREMLKAHDVQLISFTQLYKKGR
jgi:predicted glycoside hydrolase/deacetylase ChbG (UPF0249 family)